MPTRADRTNARGETRFFLQNRVSAVRLGMRVDDHEPWHLGLPWPCGRLLMGSGVVPLGGPSGATGCTQPVRLKPWPRHGLYPTRGTRTGGRSRVRNVTTPEPIKSLAEYVAETRSLGRYRVSQPMRRNPASA
jgi:hypothetical protein